MHTPGADDTVALPRDLKRANRQSILRVLRRGEATTAAAIHAETGISRPTVMRALQDWRQAGVVKSLGLGSATSAGGKKPELFVFADPRKILCINLWPREITLALSGLTGDVYGLTAFPCPHGDTLAGALNALKDASAVFLPQQGVTLTDLYGVALSVPGTVDAASMTLRYNSQAPGWGVNVCLADALRPIFGNAVRYAADNAGKAAGRAVLPDRPDYAERRLLTLFTTWGVSACMIERGHVLSGRDSLIGEIGHMLISDTGPTLCGCGKRGCLESLVSLSHVQILLEQAGAARLWQEEPLTFRRLFRFSEMGDPAARQVVRYLAHCFAVALHNLSLSYNQDTVLFQGDFAWADEHFHQSLLMELKQFRYYPAGDPFSLLYDRRELPLLSARGAAALLRRTYFNDLT